MLHRWMTPTEPYGPLGTTDRYSQVGLMYWITPPLPGPKPEAVLRLPYNRMLDIRAAVAERLPNARHVNEVAKALIGG